MGLKDIDRETLVKLYWEKCQNALIDTDVAIASERWNSAANRVYYSVFYAVSALFVKDGHPIKTHRGAKAVLSKEYVLTGKVSRESFTFFSQLETLRDKADYNVAFLATREEIMDYRPKADAFIAAISVLMDAD